MPFDGNPETFVDETTAVLIKARRALVEYGWCVGSRLDGDGRRCALGAIEAAQMRGAYDYVGSGDPAVMRLAGAIPADFGYRQHKPDDAHRVAAYNNIQTTIEPILDWFDRAIGDSK